MGKESKARKALQASSFAVNKQGPVDTNSQAKNLKSRDVVLGVSTLEKEEVLVVIQEDSHTTRIDPTPVESGYGEGEFLKLVRAD